MIRYLLLVDKTKLISCGEEEDKKIKIWNLDTFECLRVLEGHSDIVVYLDLTTEGNLISCSNDKTVILWQLETGVLLKSIQFDYFVNCAKVLFNSNLVAISINNGEIKMYDLDKLIIIKSIKADSTFVNRLHLLSNGNLLSTSKTEIKLNHLLE